MSIDVTVKKFEKEIELADKNKYIIKKGDDEKISFNDKGDDEKEITIKIKKKDEKDDQYKDAKLKVKYDGHWYSHGVKVSSKTIDGFSTLTLNKEEDLGLGVKGWKWPFWAVIVVSALAFLGLIWWWIASSRKEDKEEESL